MMTMNLDLRQAVQVLEELYPLRYAEDWDHPGLIVGDYSWPVRTIYCAVDPTYEVVEDALVKGADLLITHHPLFFRPTHTVGGQDFRGDIVNRLIEGHCGLWVGHTNADSAYRGQAQAFVELLGLKDQGPLDSIDDPSAPGPVGLGRIGLVPQTGLGGDCEADPSAGVTLEAFARKVAQVLPDTRLGITVAGDLAMPVRKVAVLPGSGDSMIDQAVACGADVYVTSDLRHHPVTDAWQQAAYEARLSGSSYARPAFINTPHSAIEKLWLSQYGIHDIPQAIAEAFGEPMRPEIILTDLNTDPWTLRI